MARRHGLLALTSALALCLSMAATGDAQVAESRVLARSGDAQVVTRFSAALSESAAEGLRSFVASTRVSGTPTCDAASSGGSALRSTSRTPVAGRPRRAPHPRCRPAFGVAATDLASSREFTVRGEPTSTTNRPSPECPWSTAW